MKNIITLLLIISSFSVYSQIEVSPMVGYFFGGRSQFYEGDIKIQDNIDYGIHLAFEMGAHSGAELSYTTSPSVAEWRPSFNYSEDFPARDFNMNTHIFLLGGYKGMELANDQVIGFVNFKGGAILYHPSEGNISDVWRFLISAGGGIKYFINDKIGLRIQANMYMPLYFNGAGIYCGIGSGGSNCGASLNGTAVIFQGDITGGLIFKLGY